MIRSSNPLAMEPRYELITQVLRRNIVAGQLPVGLVLLEGPIGALMQTSRAPVHAALRQLLAEGLIHRFEGRGFLVGRESLGTRPLRRDISEFDLDIPDQVDDALQTRGTWKHVYEQIEDQVASCQIFGEFRIIETALAEYLGVSRTVVRDVLARLHGRGLIRKNSSSHWIAGPLTARILREKYELRAIVEPAALLLAAPHISYEVIEQIRERIDSDSTLSWEAMEDALMEHCIAKAQNMSLVEIIRNNRLLLSSVNRALTGLGLPPDDIALDQYRTLFHLIARHSIDSAAEYLRGHLQIMTRKSLSRMKIVGVISETQDFASYLTPL